jgi:hypothetical protein
MPYYRGDCRNQNYAAGDYYQGDYYRGDGLFSGLGKVFGGIAKAAVGGVKGFISGGPLGAVAGAGKAIGLIQGPRNFLPQGPPLPGGFGGLPMIGPPSGGAPPDQYGGVQMIPTAGGMMLCPIKGTRVNKSTYITRGGGTSRWPQQIIVHPKGTECVKPRRMNVTNPRALRRGIRRMQGFAKLSRRVLRWVSAKPPKGRPVAKRAR